MIIIYILYQYLYPELPAFGKIYYFYNFQMFENVCSPTTIAATWSTTRAADTSRAGQPGSYPFKRSIQQNQTRLYRGTVPELKLKNSPLCTHHKTRQTLILNFINRILRSSVLRNLVPKDLNAFFQINFITVIIQISHEKQVSADVVKSLCPKYECQMLHVKLYIFGKLLGSTLKIC